MCLTEGEDCGKAYKIYEAIEKSFEKSNMLWTNCVSLSVDNTNSLVGCHNSVASRFLKKNPECFIAGCPCHLAHIAASSANDAFSSCIGVNVEDVCVDWFDKSTKRKGKLTEYFEFCDQEYQAVLKHLSVRWLSLERCMERILKKFPSLKAYFLSEGWADDRFRRLNSWFTNPLLEPSFLFNSATITMFTNFNRLLQREEPTIHLLKGSMEQFGMRLAKRIIKPVISREASSVGDIDLSDESIFIDPMYIFLGGTTKFMLNRLLNEGTISEAQFETFHTGVQSYFKKALQYIQNKFPLKDEVICDSVWIDVEKKVGLKMGKCIFFL